MHAWHARARACLHGFRYSAGGGEMLELNGQGGFATEIFTAISKEIPRAP
jgi:hypothetical protein